MKCKQKFPIKRYWKIFFKKMCQLYGVYWRLTLKIHRLEGKRKKNIHQVKQQIKEGP